MIFTIFFLITNAFAYGPPKNQNKSDYDPKICEKAELLIPDMVGQIIDTKTDVYCFDETHWVMTSKNCKEKCELKEKARKNKIRLDYNGQGTPGSILCTTLGGTNLMAYLKHKDEKHQVALCTLDKDIISVEYLLKLRQ